MSILQPGFSFDETAVVTESGYNDFGIHAKTANLYGYKPSDIVNVKLKIAENQTIPTERSNEVDYWGWFDFDENEFTMIYPKRMLLNMCFAYGIKAAENVNSGKSYRLEIVKCI